MVGRTHGGRAGPKQDGPKGTGPARAPLTASCGQVRLKGWELDTKRVCFGHKKLWGEKVNTLCIFH